MLKFKMTLLYIKYDVEFTKETSRLFGRYFEKAHFVSAANALSRLEQLPKISLIILDEDCATLKIVQALLEMQKSNYKLTIIIKGDNAEYTKALAFRNNKQRVYCVQKPLKTNEYATIFKALYPQFIHDTWNPMKVLKR